MPSLGGPPPCRPGSGKMTVVANSTEPSCWSLTRNHTQFPCLFLSGFPLWSPDVVHPLWAQSGARLIWGREGGEARGQASSRRRPGDRLQASWLCPSSLGSPANPASFSPASSPLLPPQPEHLCAQGMWLPARPERLSPRMLTPLASSPLGVGPQGHLSSKPPPGSGVSPQPPPPPRALPPASLPGSHPLPSPRQLFMLATQPELLGGSGLDLWAF